MASGYGVLLHREPGWLMITLRLNLTVSYLDGNARTYWLARELALRLEKDLSGEPKIPTLKFFEDTMIMGFGTIDPIQSAWDRLVKLRQGSLSVEEYARQFDSICAELGLEGPNENDKIVRFKSGLHPKMQNHVVVSA